MHSGRRVTIDTILLYSLVVVFIKGTEHFTDRWAHNIAELRFLTYKCIVMGMVFYHIGWHSE